MLRIGGRPILSPNDRAKPGYFHPAGNANFTDWKTHVIEFIRNFGAAITNKKLMFCEAKT